MLFTDDFVLDEIRMCGMICPDKERIAEIRRNAEAIVFGDDYLAQSIMGALDCAIDQANLPTVEEGRM